MNKKASLMVVLLIGLVSIQFLSFVNTVFAVEVVDVYWEYYKEMEASGETPNSYYKIYITYSDGEQDIYDGWCADTDIYLHTSDRPIVMVTLLNSVEDTLPTSVSDDENWDKINYGYSITNVGKVSIPVNYGDLTIESVYGPFFYSDVNEKTVGVITVGDKITYILTYNRYLVDDKFIERLRNRFNHYITEYTQH